MRIEAKRDGYYVLINSGGHNIFHFLEDRTLKEARDEQKGFAKTSDNGVAGITTSRGVAKGWESRCYHYQEGMTSTKQKSS